MSFRHLGGHKTPSIACSFHRALSGSFSWARWAHLRLPILLTVWSFGWVPKRPQPNKNPKPFWIFLGKHLPSFTMPCPWFLGTHGENMRLQQSQGIGFSMHCSRPANCQVLRFRACGRDSKTGFFLNYQLCVHKPFFIIVARYFSPKYATPRNGGGYIYFAPLKFWVVFVIHKIRRDTDAFLDCCPYYAFYCQRVMALVSILDIAPGYFDQRPILRPPGEKLRIGNIRGPSTQVGGHEMFYSCFARQSVFGVFQRHIYRSFLAHFIQVEPTNPL